MQKQDFSLRDLNIYKFIINNLFDSFLRSKPFHKSFVNPYFTKSLAISISGPKY